MPNARMLLFTMILMGALPNRVDANEHGGHGEHAPAAPATALATALATEVGEPSAEAAAHAVKAEAAPAGPVVALDGATGRSYHQGEMIEAGAQGLALVDKKNNKIDLSPYTVAEFGEGGAFRLLRGAVVAESRGETFLRTSSARVDFTGRVAVSYDHKESSTSAFVLDGEARVVNAHGEDQSLRLERYRGATMVVGDVMPQLIRQLDVGGVRSWLAGYAWSPERINEYVQAVPEAMAAAPAKPAGPQTKLEDYFSAIDTAEEEDQPDYYSRKFQDPTAAVAAANQPKSTAPKALTPEEAALIALPNTKIDLGFNLPPQVLSADQKQRELTEGLRQAKKPAARLPASVKKVAGHGPASVGVPSSGDSDVDAVLARLRDVRGKPPVISGLPEMPAARGPSSAGSVPDPVYDYSQNF